MSGLLITGAGLILRRFQPDDLDAFLGWRTDPEVALYQSWTAMDRDAARTFLSEVAVMPIPCAGRWAQIAVARPDGTAIGDIGLFLSADQREAEIGISLSRAVQGRGLGRSAVALAARYLFDNSVIERCLLWSDVRNAASLAMIASLGAQPAGGEETVQPDGSVLVEKCFVLPRPPGC